MYAMIQMLWGEGPLGISQTYSKSAGLFCDGLFSKLKSQTIMGLVINQNEESRFAIIVIVSSLM